jgi:predicted nucleotidyltransferase
MDESRVQEALERFIAAAQADERIVAVLLYGSHAAGTADEFSDLDLGVVTADGRLDEVMGEREALIRAIGEPLFLDDFGNPANVHAILAGGQVVELIFSSASELEVEGPYRVLLDKAGLEPKAKVEEAAPSAEEVRRLVCAFWHDVEHVATALGRGHLLWAHGGLEQLRATCLRLARLRAGADREDDEPYWKVDEALDPPIRAAVLATIVPPEPAQMRDAALALVRLYQSLAEPMASQHGFAYPSELDALVTERLRRGQ